MKKLLILLVAVLLLTVSGCSNNPQNASSDSTDATSENVGSSLTEDSSYPATESSTPVGGFDLPSVFVKKSLTKIELLRREFENVDGKKAYGHKFLVQSTLEDKDSLSGLEEHLFGSGVKKSTDGWVKFNPARANEYAIKAHCDDGSAYIINLHFDKDSSVKYIAVAFTDKDIAYDTFVSSSEANDRFQKCIADKECGEYLIGLFSNAS